jgi:hypothetical protein
VQHESSSPIEDAFRLLVEVVGEYSAHGRRTVSASLKPALQQRSLGGFSEQKLGFPTFRQFLRAAEGRGLVALLPAGVDLEVRPLGDAAAPISFTSDSRPESPVSIRPDLWRCFIDWKPGWRRVYRKDADQAIMFPENPVPLEPAEFTAMRSDWKVHPERYVAITPIPQDVHIGWMREFAGGVTDAIARGALEAALKDDRPAAAFMEAVRAFPKVGSEWRARRLEHVLTVIRTWIQTHGLELKYAVSRPRRATMVRVAPPAIDGFVAERLRSILHSAIDKMPVAELLKVRISAEYFIDI